jgi:hypothetical protein
MIELLIFIFAIFVFLYLIRYVVQIFWALITPFASLCAILIIAYFVLTVMGAVHA